MFSSILNINRIVSFLDVIPNFIQTAEIEAILESKRILVYTLLINKSGNDLIHKIAIFCEFNICPALNIPIGFSLPLLLEFWNGGVHVK